VLCEQHAMPHTWARATVGAQRVNVVAQHGDVVACSVGVYVPCRRCSRTELAWVSTPSPGPRPETARQDSTASMAMTGPRLPLFHSPCSTRSAGSAVGDRTWPGAISWPCARSPALSEFNRGSAR
jgi:hypothetical protein